MSTQPAKKCPPRLTVAIHAADDPSSLEQTIDSVRAIADELLIVVAPREDGTLPAAPAPGAIVIAAPDADDRAAARNLALRQAQGDWVLWLDSGETMATDDATALKLSIVQDARPHCAYLLHVEVPPAAGFVSSEQAIQLRVVPAGSEIVYEGRVRESVVPAADITRHVWNCRIQAPCLQQDDSRRTAHAERDLKRADLEILEHQDRPETLLARAEALASLGRYAEAVQQYRATVVRCEPKSTVRLEAFYGLLTALDGIPDSREVQVAACLEALDENPLDAQLLCAMGSYMLAQKRLDLAERSYAVAVDHGKVDAQTWHLTDIGEVTVASLALTQQLQGKEDAAVQTLRDGLARMPQSQRLLRQLANLHIKHRRTEDALEIVGRLADDPPQREALSTAVRGAVLVAENHYAAALPYLESAYRAGCRDPICLRSLAVSYLAAENFAAALPVLKQWQDQQPDNAEIATYLKAIADRNLASEPTPSPRIDRRQAPSRLGAIPETHHTTTASNLS